MKFPEHYSENESRDPELRERELLSALPEFIAHAKKNSPAYAEFCGKQTPATSPPARRWRSCPP